MWDYYSAACQRSFYGAWEWAVGQGLWLTLFIVIATAAFAVLRRLHGRWSQPLERTAIIRDVARKGLIDFVGTASLFSVVIFLCFLVNDPPEQLRQARERGLADNNASATQIDRLKVEITMLKDEVSKKSIKGFFVECHPLSTLKLDFNGRAHIVDIFDQQYLGASETTGVPESTLNMNLSDDNPQLLWFRTSQCTVTNYTDESLFDVEIKPTIGFLKTSIDPDGSAHGNGIDHQRSASVYIPRLDVGTQNLFLFYFLNFSPFYVDVTMPPSATAHILGATDPTSFPLHSNVIQPLSLVPRIPVKSAASH
jgi:hypothetical protein